MKLVTVYNLYLRLVLFLTWLLDYFRCMYLVRVFEHDDHLCVRLNGRIVRLELYPSNNVVGFQVGTGYYTTLKPMVTQEREFKCDSEDEQD